MTLGLERPCLGCGVPVAATRCARCQAPRTRKREQRRGKTAARGYGASWQALAHAVLARDGWVCRYCGAPAKTADHLIPKACGGIDDPSNLVAACLSCNSTKAHESWFCWP